MIQIPMLRHLSLRLSPVVASLAVAAVCLAPLVVGSRELEVQNQSGPRPSPCPAGADLDRGGLIAKHCLTCHNERTKTGELALDLVMRGSVRDHAPVWEDVLHK